MARLTARRVETAKVGKHGDGDGLYLIVRTDGSRKWALRFMQHGKAREMGLGSARDFSLAEAREKAFRARKALREGKDPITERKRAGGVPTFGELADEVRQSLEIGFRSAKHRQQWKNTLTTYAAPLWSKTVDAITTDDVLAVLKPIWTSKAETASRVRGRIEKVLDAAKAKGLRRDENPARWRGHLDHLLPKQSKLARGHHAAMPYGEVADFVGKLRNRNATAALALEFTILTVARSGEVLGSQWEEFDLENAIWTVPASRMKAGREHRVPLPKRALEILTELDKIKRGAFVFAGQKPERPLSNMAMEMILRRMDIKAVTVHGYRSSFRDWAGNVSNFPREIIEEALAHVIGSKAERAYRRSDALEKRRKLLEAWAAFCEPGQRGRVVRFKAKG